MSFNISYVKNKPYCIYWFDDDHFYHKENGPAIEYSCGEKVYFVHGKRHREDGPAVEMRSITVNAYWINGIELSEKEFNENRNNIFS